MDPACADARRGGKSRRTRSAVIVEHLGAKILIDAGPDIADQMAREKIQTIDAVLLTHGHADACAGLGILDARLKKPTPLFTDAKTRVRLQKWFPNLKNISFSPLIPFRPIRVGALSIIPFPVRHSMTAGFPTFGFYFGKRFAYASDVAAIPLRAQKLFFGVKTFVLDGAMYFDRGMPAHFTPDAAIAIARDLKISHLILTQIGHTYPPHAQAARDVAAYHRSLRTRFPKKVTLAFDGMVLDLKFRI